VRYHAFSPTQFSQIKQLQNLSPERRFAMEVIACVLPFKVNSYLVEELIDWGNIPEDPIFQMVFPQPEMLAPEHFSRIADLLHGNADQNQILQAAHAIRLELNPHPAAQLTLNVPRLNGERLPGLQHKYRETVLYFPSHGQTCHAYCSFCFRWPQFVGEKHLHIGSSDPGGLHRYLKKHREVTDLLVTGGDPLIMAGNRLEAIFDPLLSPEFDHIQNLRVGTKALSFWPYRFVTDDDADKLLRLFERLVKAGKHVAYMAHFCHWRELETDILKEAVRRIRDTGAIIRTQSPVVAHINDRADIWALLWKRQVQLGMVPYYQFVARNTGPRSYFEVPLARCWEIYREALQQVSGLGRTVRGPSMSAGPGKVEIQGVAEIEGEKTFVLRFIQGRNPDWVQRPFFACFDRKATWLDQLRPAFGEERFFYEQEYREMRRTAGLEA
jgi:L-lysine 2,3-aminomutase